MPADSKADTRRRIIIGRICGIHGVSGWLKVLSYTRPRENLFNYQELLVGEDDRWQLKKLLEGKQQGKGLIARFDGLPDRDLARQFVGRDIAVFRDQMPELEKGEYYWCDLIGLTVIDQNGTRLGTVSDILETGANDVMVVTGKQRQLIPLVFDQYIEQVDLEQFTIVVDWDSRYI